ncbi:MAG TPA: hypothetical protein VII34_12805 [Pyrinomonadaceae bacterium]
MKFLLIFSLTLLSAVVPAPQTGRQWRPATYRGVTVGKSRVADMLRAWGKPKWSRTSRREADEESQVTWTNYERVGEFPGPTTVVSDTKTGAITRINFYPDRLAKEQAIGHFGSDYLITRYSFDSCLDEEDEEPIYESPTGPVVSLEYRARGIAISIGFKDLVTEISYVGGPIGSTKSRCNQ